MADLETYGLMPGTPDWKIFEVDGWSVKVERCESDSGDSWGIKYSAAIAPHEVEVSVFVGHPDQNGKMADAFNKSFDEMDVDGARRGLQMILRSAAPMMAQRGPLND
jgi:hypothetical protein